MGQHEWNRARCKRVVVAVGNCTRAMCVRARRCQCASTESARSPPQRLTSRLRVNALRQLSQLSLSARILAVVVNSVVSP